MTDGHAGCRIRDFARWNRVMLEHERDHLSRAMLGRAFMKAEEAAAIVHDITDIDYLLAELAPRIAVPGAP